MDVVLYTGNGYTSSGTQTVSGLGFSPDLVWIKSRSFASNHALLDTIRGTNNILVSNTTDAERIDGTDNLTSFNSDGFSLGVDSYYAYVNRNNETYAAWTWDAGSSTVTNTQGSITSQVRANPSAGFSIVTYTGNGTAGATVGHGLGIAPSLYIVKARSTAGLDWGVYHVSTGGTQRLLLNSTAAAATNVGYWNNTSPTSTTFSLGTFSLGNLNGTTYVAYCFASVESYSAFGSYTGNGLADGPFVFCNFRPRWVIWKNTTNAGSWYIHDAVRSPYNVTEAGLFPNVADAENTTYTDLDILSNGFKQRRTDNDNNASGNTYIYAAFSEAAFSVARAR
jgi:hypothetical protein